MTIILDFLLALLSGLIITLIRVFIKHKEDSNKWKERHSERLAKIEQRLIDLEKENK